MTKANDKKEIAFIWSMWNKIVAINVWKTKVDRSANHECAVCGKIIESILHRLQDFKNA
jgi:hypothetical protein